MARRVTAVLTMTAVGALALAGVQPVSASAAGAGHPAAVAADVHPAPPPAFHRALLATAGRTRLTLGRPARSAAGLRPIGEGVSTDLPTRLAVGSEFVRVPYTVIVPTSGIKDPAIDIGLGVVRGMNEVLESETFVIGTPGQTTFRGVIAIPVTALTLVGRSEWGVVYGSATSTDTASAFVGVTVKTNSLLGEAVTRRGDTVRVIGAAKVFRQYTAGDSSYLGTYVGRPGLRVGVDRYAGNGTYVRLTTVTTDRLGHLDISVRIPWTVGIRLVDADTGTVFGAVTPSKTV